MGRWQDLQDMLDGRSSARQSDANTAVVTLLVGLTAGVTMGLLLAPDSGQSTRDKLRQKARNALDKGQNKADEVKLAAADKIGQAASTAQGVAEDAKRAAQDSETRNRNIRPGN